MTTLFTIYATLIGVGGYMALRIGGLSLLASAGLGCAATVGVAAMLAM